MLPTALVVVFAAAAACVLGPGYLLRLRLLPRRPGGAPDPEAWPDVDVVVPTHEEAGGIEAKIRNLRDLEYPGALHFWLADGASSDGTREIAVETAAGDPRFSFLAVPVADKTAQLNRAIAAGHAAWVLVTDADARLAPDAVTRLAREAEADPAIGAVGATVRPAGAHASERLHWRIADRLRLAESRRGAASIVTAPCYLFRRGGTPVLPADVVADDVHAAFHAAASGRRVAFVEAGVEELRNPVSMPELARHKFRKGKAYVREVLRFLPRTTGMTPAARCVFRWRAAQLLAGPPIMAALAAAALAGVVAGGPAAWTLAAALAAAGGSNRRVRAAAALGAALVVALLGALAALPFRHEGASFRKIDARRRCADPHTP